MVDEKLQNKTEEIKISTRTKITYGIGGFGKNLAYGLVSSYTLYYYNSVLNVSAAFIGTLLMLARIFDAFNDPLMGVIVTRTKSRFGRYKPWIFSGAILNALIMYAMFSVPYSLEGNSLKIYVAVTYLLCGVTYTLSDIPFWSIIPAVTRPGLVRESMTSIARLLAGIGAGTPTVCAMAAVYLLGGGHDNLSLRKGFSLLALILSVVYIVTMLFNVKDLPNSELSVPSDSNKTSVKQLFMFLLKNDQALCIALIIVLFNSAIYITSNLVLYIFQYDIQKESSYIYFMGVSGVVQIISMMLYSRLRKKISNRGIYFAALVFACVAYILFTAVALCGHFSVIKAIIPCIIVSAANGLSYVLITIFISGAVDYGEVKNGTRENSMISSLQTLMSKLSSAFAVFLAGIGIDFVKLNPELAVQTDFTLFKLRMVFCIPSLVFAVAALILFARKKDLGIDISR